MKQIWENLPFEIKTSRRFFLVAENKRPLQKDWSNPAVQKAYTEIDGLAGFDTCGHGQAPDYLFLDFDHILDKDSGDFVNSSAADCVKKLQKAFPSIYIEKSISGTGLHAFLVPTEGKFNTVSNGKLGVFHFDTSKDKSAPKLELFYGSGGRYCLCTGILANDGDQIPCGADVDDFLTALLDKIKAQANPSPVVQQEADIFRQHRTDFEPEYEQALALECLKYIDPSQLEDTEWLAVISACKNLDIDYSIVDSWNQRDANRYNASENQNRWDSLNDSSYDIKTLIGKAQQSGFSVKDFYRQWHKDKTDYSSKETFTLNIDAPINLKLPRGFNIYEGKLTHNGGVVSYTPALVTKELQQGDRVSYEVAFLVDKHWKYITVKAGELSDKSKLVALSDFGLGVNTGNSKKMCQYFAHLIGINKGIIPVEKLYSHGGWIDDNCTSFVYPNNEKVVGYNFDYASAFKTCGKEPIFRNLFLKALTDSDVARLVVGLGLAAPLIRPLSISNKQMHLGCRSGSGKTAIVKLVLAIFGNPNFLMAKFNATANSLEIFSAALTDFPSAIDELQTINKFQRETIDELLYNFESRKIRGRLRKTGELKDFEKFYGCRITTGEHSLTTEFSGEGAKKRCVEIIDNKILREELAIEIHRIVDRNYGFYGRKWCNFIEHNLQTIKEDYDACYDALLAHNRNAFPEHISLVAVAQVALKYFCELIFDSSEVDEILAKFDTGKILEQLLNRQEMQNGKRAIATVAEMCARYSKFFLQLGDEGETPTAEGDRAPFEKYGYVLQNGDTLVFQKTLRDWLKEFPNFQAIVRDFSELGYLVEFKSKNRPHQRSIKVMNKTIWGYVFKAEALGNVPTCEREPQEEIPEPYEPPVDNGYDFEED